MQNLLNVINNRDKIVAKYRFNSNSHSDSSLLYSNKKNTELQKAILEASKGIYPVDLFSSKNNQTVELLTQPLIIQESEILKAQATNANRLHVIVSLLEIS